MKQIALYLYAFTFLSPCVLYLLGFFNPKHFSSELSSRSAILVTPETSLSLRTIADWGRSYNPALTHVMVDRSDHVLVHMCDLQYVGKHVNKTNFYHLLNINNSNKHDL